MNPDVWTYVVAFALAVVSGLLFGIVPVRQVLKADPWQMIRAGGTVGGLRRFTLRDLLLAGQIAICAVLVTSSLVAVRGLARSLHSNFGFQPEHAMLVDTDLQMAGYTGDKTPEMQKRMLDAVAAIPGVTAVGYVDHVPLGLGGGDSFVYARRDHGFPADQYGCGCDELQRVAGIFCGGGHDDAGGERHQLARREEERPVVAVVNREFARKVFGSVDKAMGGHFKFWGGNRAEVVGVVERRQVPDADGRSAAGDVLFRSCSMRRPTRIWWCGRTASRRRLPRRWSGRCTGWMRGCRSASYLESRAGFGVVRGAGGEHGAGSAGAAGRDAGGDGDLRHGLVCGDASGCGSWGFAWRWARDRSRCCGRRWGGHSSCWQRVRWLGIVLGVLATKVLSFIVYQATPKDPVVLGGVVVVDAVAGAARGVDSCAEGAGGGSDDSAAGGVKAGNRQQAVGNRNKRSAKSERGASRERWSAVPANRAGEIDATRARLLGGCAG